MRYNPKTWAPPSWRPYRSTDGTLPLAAHARTSALLGAVTDAIGQRTAAWAERRQGPDSANVVLLRRRVYILPTRFGVAYAILVLAMLLGSMNYASSLAFGLTFLLAGLGLVMMHHCHNNLLGTRVRFAGAQPVFAGEPAEFRILVGNETEMPRYELSVGRRRVDGLPCDLQPGATRARSISVLTEGRGWVKLPRCSVSTQHPANLFHAWSWIHMNARCLVYPRPAPPGLPLPSAGGADGMQGSNESGEADFAGLRAAMPGDPPRRIAWKAYARNDKLLIKQFSGGQQRAEMLNWDSLPKLPTEERLSQLTRWCLDAAEDGWAFGLVLPTKTVPLGKGQSHLHECLRALALFEDRRP